jgi:hypothetical protein
MATSLQFWGSNSHFQTSTLDIYAQATTEADRAAADVLGNDSFPATGRTPAEDSPDARWNQAEHQGPPLRTALTWRF